MSDLYEHDFCAWANQQSSLLRAGKPSSADIEHIAAEIESMGRSEKRELVNRLTDILADAWGGALLAAQRETGLPEDAFPAVGPWTYDEVMRDQP